MNNKTRVFSIIKALLVVFVIISAIGLSYFSSGGDRNGDSLNQQAMGNNDGLHTNQDSETEFTQTSQQLETTTTENIQQSEADKEAELEAQKEEALIDAKLAQMTTEEKVAQVFFLCVKQRFGPELISEYPVGGILLFANDVQGESREGLTEKIASYQEQSDIPLLVGIDEEGGTVSRLNTNPQLIDYRFQSPRDIYAKGGFDAIKDDTEKKCELLKSYGFNVNFAPVCDLAGNIGDYMYLRSFGDDVELTEEYITLMEETMNSYNMGSVLKHFPGYGNNGDTHTNIIRDERSYDTFANNDFKPFEAGIKAGAGCILVSHNIVTCIDNQNPASLSKGVHEIIRNELGFDGVIITDDLSMDGVADYLSNDEAAIVAFEAGNDMLISTYYDDQYEAILEAVKLGRISEERLDESVRRILKWKYSLKIME